MAQEISLKRDKKKLISQKAIKVSRAVSDPRHLFLNFSVKQGRFKMVEDMTYLYGVGNTTALAAQIAINLGCANIVLLGTDCQYKGKDVTDFYGKNKDHKPYTLKMCNGAMKWLSKTSPVPIYNCSKNKLWPRMELKNVIKQLKPKKRSRKEYLNIFRGEITCM